jgi:hypothetical protein
MMPERWWDNQRPTSEESSEAMGPACGHPRSSRRGKYSSTVATRVEFEREAGVVMVGLPRTILTHVGRKVLLVHL